MGTLARAGSRGGLITLATQGASLVTRILLMAILARLIAPEIFGVTTIAIGISAIATSLALLGLGMAGAQAPHLSHNTQSILSHTQTALGAFLAGVIYASAATLADWYQHDDLEHVLQVLAIVPLVQGFQSQYRIRLIRELRFGALGTSEIVSLLGAALVSVILAVASFDHLAIIAPVVAQPIIQLLILMAVTRWLPSLKIRLDAQARETLTVGFRILSMNLSRNVSRSGLTPLMGLNVSAGPLGQFDRGLQLATAPVSAAIDQLQQVAVPVLAKLRHEPGRGAHYMARAQLLVIHSGCTGLLVLAGVGSPLVQLIFGPGWESAATVFAILCFGAAFRILGESMSWVFIASGNTRSGARLGAWSQPAIVVLSLCGLPWGIMGVALANTVAWMLYWPLATRIACRTAGFPVHLVLGSAFRSLARFSIPVAVMATCVQWATAQTPVMLSLALSLGAALLTGVTLLLIPPIRRELKLVSDTIRLARR